MSHRDRRPTRPTPSTEIFASAHSLLAVERELLRGLVDTVNHHLRTPLTAILGHAELLVDHEHGLPAEVNRSLACLLRAGARLNDAVAGVCDLIDVTWVDPDTVDRIDVAALVAEEVTAHRDRATQRGISLLTVIRPGATCVADPKRVRRALAELVDNALTYAPDLSSVRVETIVRGTAIRIEVSDGGDGIDPADLPRLVNPFERGSHPRQPVGGRGLGLALAAAIAASHGGRLILSESLGGGLRACLELPVDFTPPSGPTPPASGAGHPGRRFAAAPPGHPR